MRGFVGAVVASILTIVFIGALQSTLTSTHYGVMPTISDFRVVYCGERTVFAHRDPYLTEPLRACENTFQPSMDTPAWAVTPFPLPGYAAALFAPFGLLPYHLAKYAWLATLVLSFGITAAAIAAIVRVQAWTVAAIFAPTLAFLDFIYGEPANISIAALALAALALDRGRPRLAALGAAVAMIEPHVGLPACLGLFVLVPRARIVLGGAAVGLGALSLVTIGLAHNVEYFTTFLPLQARAEISAVDQYSLSHVLFLAGVAPSTAMLLGDLSYAAMVALGIVAAFRVTKLGLSRALVVLMPVSAAMLGGPFVHDVEIAAALPAALILASRSAFARAAVSLLAVQWGLVWRGLIIMVTASALGLASIALPEIAAWRRVAYAFIVVALILFLNAMLARPGPPPDVIAIPHVVVAGDAPAPISWEHAIRLSARISNLSKDMIAIKVPTWIALAIVPLSFLELEILAAPVRLRRKKGASESERRVLFRSVE